MELAFSYLEIKNFIISILPALLIAPIIFLATFLYNKHIRFRPKLAVSFIKTLPPSVNRKSKHLEVLWHATVKIKNLSRHTSYSITGKFALGPQIKDQHTDKLLLPDNPLASDGSMDAVIKKRILKKPDDVLAPADEHEVFHAGLLHKLIPEAIGDVKFYLKYKNEFGRTFYTRFRKVNGIESNTFSLVRPYLFNDFIFWLKEKLKIS